MLTQRDLKNSAMHIELESKEIKKKKDETHPDL
jgi:hypothetical protein